MTAHSSLDPESFQKLLSNAFEVQESGMDSESLATIVDIQRSITNGELDADGAMEFVAISARNVANAAGVAIGLLKEDQLLYRAGSGSAAAYVGLRVMATLCVSAHDSKNGEILRVENAQADERIEAAICRQFGAQALLILPIYRGRIVAGVLEVLFNEAHVFQNPEVRSYRLMVALVEEAMSRAIRPVPVSVPSQTSRVPAHSSPMQTTVARTAAIPTVLPSQQPAAVTASSQKPTLVQPSVQEVDRNQISFHRGGAFHLHCPACGNEVSEDSNLAKVLLWTQATVKRVQQAPLYALRWESAVAAVLTIACWIAYRDLRNQTTWNAPIRSEASTLDQQVNVTPVKQVLVDGSFGPQNTLRLADTSKHSGSRSKLRLAGNGNEQVRYFSDDVTVRYFNPKPAKKQAAATNSTQVRHISDDVTVRYFAPAAQASNPNVHYVSNDAGR